VKTARKKCIFNLLHRLFPEKTSGTALKPVHNRLFPKETAITSSSEMEFCQACERHVHMAQQGTATNKSYKTKKTNALLDSSTTKKRRINRSHP
jgi:hypothetical protein